MTEPTSPLITDKAALTAFRAYCRAYGSDAVSHRHDLNPRTLERMFSRSKPLPRSLAAEIGQFLMDENYLTDEAETLISWGTEQGRAQ